MKGNMEKVRIALKVKNIHDSRDQENPRDWDFEGSYQALIAEVQRDSVEYGCESYAVYNTDGNLWAIWRLL